jgi:hypothetical protein
LVDDGPATNLPEPLRIEFGEQNLEQRPDQRLAICKHETRVLGARLKIDDVIDREQLDLPAQRGLDLFQPHRFFQNRLAKPGHQGQKSGGGVPRLFFTRSTVAAMSGPVTVAGRTAGVNRRLAAHEPPAMRRLRHNAPRVTTA